jgi:hypothetical protein
VRFHLPVRVRFQCRQEISLVVRVEVAEYVAENDVPDRIGVSGPMDVLGVQSRVGFVESCEQGAQGIYDRGLTCDVGSDQDIQTPLKMQFGLFELSEIGDVELRQIHRLPLPVLLSMRHSLKQLPS